MYFYLPCNNTCINSLEITTVYETNKETNNPCGQNAKFMDMIKIYGTLISVLNLRISNSWLFGSAIKRQST